VADEEGLRQEAVRRHLAGEDAASIGADMGRSERWVYKWVARHEVRGGDGWFVSESRRPERSPNATGVDTVSLLLAARDRLEADPRAQRGATAIAWELVSMGVEEGTLPATRTMERILSREGRSKPRQRVGQRYKPKGTPYPGRAARCRPGVLHEIDPVGPRYLDGAQEVYSLNVMDVGSHRIALEPLARPTPQAFAEHLVAAWGRLGPQIAQFDNAPSLRGEIGNGRVFGPVVRACLDLGVKVRYIPLEEPWRNGAVEHFQDVFDKSFFRTERYRDLDHLTARALDFEAFHNGRHRYSPLGGKTPDQAWAAAGAVLQRPPKRYRIPDALPRRGRIDVIRLIRSDRVLNLFAEKLEMPEDSVYQYVVAEIHVRSQRLMVTCSGEVVYGAPHPIR
jgi:putative transposase